MESHASFDRDSGLLTVQTRTWTNNWWFGFTGCVQVRIFNGYGHEIGVSPTKSFGVDGVRIGRSDRTDTWSYTFASDVARDTYSLSIAHFRCPKYR